MGNWNNIFNINYDVLLEVWQIIIIIINIIFYILIIIISRNNASI